MGQPVMAANVTMFLEDPEETNDNEIGSEPPKKKRKTNKGHKAVHIDPTPKRLNVEDEDGILEDIPFTAQELEGEYDEESFMEKLNGYFQSKYGKELDDHIDDYPKEGDKVDIHRVSAVDIFTM